MASFFNIYNKVFLKKTTIPYIMEEEQKNFKKKFYCICGSVVVKANNGRKIHKASWKHRSFVNNMDWEDEREMWIKIYGKDFLKYIE